MANKIQIKKLNDNGVSYYPLSVLESVVTTHDITAGHDIGTYKKGDKIPAVTPLDNILSNVISGEGGGGTGNFVKTVNNIQPDTSGNVQLKIPEEYTAFEVFPTNIDIPVGTYDCNFYTLQELPAANKTNYIKYLNSIIKVGDTKYRLTKSGSQYSFEETTDNSVGELFGHNFDIVTGIDYSAKVTSADTAGFTTKVYIDQEDSDISIDWGDGNVSVIKDLTIGETVNGTTLLKYEDSDPENQVDDDRKVEIKHQYSSDKCNYRYIVKIYGQYYTTLRTYCSGTSNICSRIFEYDLPISSCVLAVSACCQYHTRLLRLNVTEYYDFKRIINFYSAFMVSDRNSETTTNNLKTVNISSKSSIYNRRACIARMFCGCGNLVTSNFHLPESSCIGNNNTYAYTYAYCSKLESDISDLLPKLGFSDKVVNLCCCFTKCSKLTGDVEKVITGAESTGFKLSDILWGDTSKIWINGVNGSERTFTGCTSLTNYDKIPTIGNWK